MLLKEVGEFGLIERIRQATPKGRGVRIGIGDDAAWVECKNRSLLITSDLLIEGIHFNLKQISFYGLGYKTLAVNLSDLAAMGGSPAYLLLSLGIPVDFKTEDVEEFYRGIQALASQSGVAIVGGDTSASRLFFISACLVGHSPHKPITRRGGKVGDDLYVTGTLGDSALGLKLLKEKGTRSKREHAYLVSRHLFPTARLKAGSTLARERLARAMIDLSDGLLQDLGHLCKASGIGAVVREEALPLSRAYRILTGKRGPLYALTGGEDYELLFCLRRRDRNRLEKIRRRLGVPIARIGECVPSREGIKVINRQGKSLSISVTGYDHFKNGT
ncbi:MAG: thiamine-phosphate kinase [Candidatus Binatota bacterium]